MIARIYWLIAAAFALLAAAFALLAAGLLLAGQLGRAEIAILAAASAAFLAWLSGPKVST